MNEEIPEVFQLETVEQLRIAADPLRLRILHPLMRQQMTVTKVGDLLGESAAKVHYHMRELERVGLVRMVETREKGGILEKYYRASGQNLVNSPALLQTMSPDEVVASLGELFQTVSSEFFRALKRLEENPREELGLRLSWSQFWATDIEAEKLMRQVETLIEPYLQPRRVPGERERTYVQISYANRADEKPPRSGGKKRATMVGVMTWDRKQLQEAIARGETYDISVLGVCSFGDDIPAELVDRAISSFRHRGILHASPEVREVLERKEAQKTAPSA